MPAPVPDSSPLPAPRKTAAGTLALNDRDPRFNAVQRRLLILIDGRRDALILQGLLPAADVKLELDTLAAAGLIDTGAGSGVTKALMTPAEKPAAAASASEAATPVLPENWPDIRVWMTEHARDHLGVLAMPLIARIEKVSDAGSMRSAISQWHMALRGSRQGHAMADDGLDHIHRMLGH